MFDKIVNKDSSQLKLKIELDNLQDENIKDLTTYLTVSKSINNLQLNGEIGYAKSGKEFKENDFKEFLGEIKYSIPNTNFYTGIQTLKYDDEEIFEFNVGRYFNEKKKSYLEFSYSKRPTDRSFLDYNDEFYNLIYGTKFDLSEYFGKGWDLNLEIGPQLYDDEINIRTFLNFDNLNFKGVKFSQDFEFFYHLTDRKLPAEEIYTTLRAEYTLI